MKSPNRFSFFYHPVTNKRSRISLTLSDVHRGITGESSKYRTELLRNLISKNWIKEAREWKQIEFDYVTFSGVFNLRRADKLMQHSGLICLDYDHITNALPEETVNSLKEKIIQDQDQELVPVLCFTSPSGDGLKAVISIDTAAGSHKEWFEALSNYFTTVYGIAPDQSGSDVCRACFIPYDPEAWIRPGIQDNPETPLPATPKSFLEKWIPVDQAAVEGRREFTPVKQFDNFCIGKEVEQVVRQIELYQLDLTLGYDNWRDLGFCFADEFGEGGRSFFHRISQFHPNYTSRECDQQFDRCLRGKRKGKTIRSFFFMAKHAGLEIPGKKNPTLNYK